MTVLITRSLSRPFLLLAFTFNRINRQFAECQGVIELRNKQRGL